jgi:hypothetical protein
MEGTVTTLISVLIIFFAVACQDQINQVFNDNSNLSINKQDLPNDVKTALSRYEVRKSGEQF